MEASTSELEGNHKTPVCAHCGSGRVVRNAWASWNQVSGLWELDQIFGEAHCCACKEDTQLKWIDAPIATSLRVRELNDQFRRCSKGNGIVVVTAGLNALGPAFIDKAVAAVSAFDAFNEDNDPWGEHDFGQVEVETQKVFWKIDCYGLDLQSASPNPGNTSETVRVLTVMLAEEY